MNRRNLLLTAFSFLVLILIYFREELSVLLMVILIVNRGILGPNCFWWRISDLLLRDGSGVELYYRMKDKYEQPFIPLSIYGTTVNLVMENDFVKQILNQSPTVFGVGKLKQKFFHSFMAKNVGVSEGEEWVNRRKVNEEVLDSDHPHRYLSLFTKRINESIDQVGLPHNFKEFSQLAQLITMKIVFGVNKIDCPAIFEVFAKANSVRAFLQSDFELPINLHLAYINYMKKHIRNPQPGSLIEIGAKLTSEEEMLHQIPHWIFPINGQIHTTVPRLLTALCSCPHEMNQLQNNFNEHIRNASLELLRLNNPVVTTYRTLLQDYCFDEQHCFKKGDQFLILNNPVLRDPEFFTNPNCYIPNRWTREMEQSYYAIMFNQGPQRCPGKELALSIIAETTRAIFLRTRQIWCKKKLNCSNFPQMINPCSLAFEYE